MEKGWYVIQTYSGYEQKIEKIINKYIEIDPEFKAYCTGVNIPVEKVKVRSDKDGEVKIEERKILPGKSSTYRSSFIKMEFQVSYLEIQMEKFLRHHFQLLNIREY